ncbi:MAG: DNA polymerase III subunit delta' [Candidatus Anammoxibacter sp.]
MSFKDILGQDHVVQTFQKIIKKSHLAHAYIFFGMDGVGKSLFAQQLTKTLNCNAVDFDSCGKCVSCRKIEAGSSPDIMWVSLQKGKKLLGIDDVRAVQDSAALKPVESNHKIFIIREADKLSEEALNCLLKTLEEPPPATMIILLIQSLDSLPETIVSRCQVIRFRSLSNDIVLTVLQENYKDKTGSIDSLEWFVQISNGSAGNAITLIEEDLYEKNKFLISSLTNLKLIDNFSLSQAIHEWIPENKKTLEEKRSYLKIILDLVLYYYRDILICKTNSFDGIHFFNPEYISLIRDQSRLLTISNISDIIDHIFTAFNNLESNANTNFLFEHLLTRIAIVTEKQ